MPILDTVYDPHYDTLYWDASQEGDAVTVEYTYVGKDSPQAYVGGQLARRVDAPQGFVVEPGSHSCVLSGYFPGSDEAMLILGEFKAVRVDGGRPPAR